MRVAVIGGRLQGVEAVYLSKKAGWEVVLIDKDLDAPAVLLCDYFYKLDVLEKTKLSRVLKNIQFIIPALENKLVLDALNEYALEAGIPIVYDGNAYSISSSKIISDKLFDKLSIPVPTVWPYTDFPVVVKPSGASGSEGVHKVENETQFNQFIKSGEDFHDLVIQEFLEGPSYSLEVIGYEGNYRVLQVTELEMDEVYDCKRVLAPAKLDKRKIEEFEEISVKIARELNITGVFDVEVILHKGKMKVLEIDARLPSQTPTAVYNSTGINLMECLWYVYSNHQRFNSFVVNEKRGTVYEHIKVDKGEVKVCGEHIMGKAGHLKFYRDFFGADEAISNYESDKEEWVATLIINGKNPKEAWRKRCEVINNIKQKVDILSYKHSLPLR
ncbi:3-methylornithine--L-lysine ligase PylC [Clostridium sp. WILCCON 0269]|uniref:3-methylornithine--L-lysine ligase PylC n=1 Tax=Candidatus Clostridium eludens TaxID=3381663 RepID=A0ABW8SF83_9CLOT